VHPLDSWNKFVKALIVAREAWNEHREIMIHNPEVDGVPVEAMRVLYATWTKAEFGLMLERFIDYWRRYGGLDGMVFKSTIKEEPRKEEEVKNARRGKDTG